MPEGTRTRFDLSPVEHQGQEKDQTTGLTNFELRQYDPRIGRWYNPDPYGQHHSPYLAMSNNPVSFTDPDGGWDGEMNGESAKDNPNNLLSTIESAQGKTWEAMSPDERATIAQATGTTYRMQDIDRLMRRLDGLGIKLEATKAHPGYYGIWYEGISTSYGTVSDGNVTGTVRSDDYGATLHWTNVIKKEDLHRYRKFQDGAVGYFFHGFFDGVGNSVAGTINFLTNDAWELETWKGFGKVMYAAGNPFLPEGQMMSRAIEDKMRNADTYDWGNVTGEVVMAIVTAKVIKSIKVGGCFVKGTLVWTEEGMKNIEDVSKNDKVYTYNIENKKVVVKTVTDTYIRDVQHLVKLEYGNEVVYTTSGHPFYINNVWVAASKLKSCDLLFSHNKALLTLEKISILDTLVKVYNFTVKDEHNYYVGNNKILVHNTCDPWIFGKFKSSSKWAGQLAKRGWTSQSITEALSTGESFPATNMINPANKATRYVHPITGQSVVIDEVTREVIHVGGPGFNY